MDILQQIILLMNRKEVKHYKIYATRAVEHNDRKDIQLFDMMRKGKDSYEDEKAFQLIYKGKEKNAFYRLKNRLTEELNKSIFLQQHSEDETMTCFYWLALAYYYHSKQSLQVAYFYFKKTEKKAIALENYGLLDIIYSKMINLATELLAENPEVLIKKRKENRYKLNKLSEVEDILEAVEYRMKITQNLGKTSSNVLDILKKTLDEYSADEELRNSPKVQFGIYFIVSRTLLSNKDYKSLEVYLEQTYLDFDKRKLFNKSNHANKLQMLAWKANASFMNKNYQQSLEDAELLKKEMERFDGMLSDKFEIFYHNTLVVNFSVINPEKAVDLLNSLTRKDFMDKQQYYGVFIYMNLALLYYQMKKNDLAIKHLSKLYQLDGFHSMDPLLKLKLNIGELLIRYDQKEFEIFDYRYRQVIKDNKIALESLGNEKEKKFLDLLGKIALNPLQIKSAAFIKSVQNYLNNFGNEFDGEEVLFKYNDWLKQKVGL